MQINVRHFPDRGGKWQVSINGATSPQWSRDGKRLFFVSLDRELMSIPVDSSGETFRYGLPTSWTTTKLEIGGGVAMNFTMTRDGARVLARIDAAPGARTDPKIGVILNFPSLIRRLANSDAAMER